MSVWGAIRTAKSEERSAVQCKQSAHTEGAARFCRVCSSADRGKPRPAPLPTVTADSTRLDGGVGLRVEHELSAVTAGVPAAL